MKRRGRIATLGLLLCVGCSHPEPIAVNIPFRARIGDQPFSCRAAPPGPGDAPRQFSANDLRFYVHDVELMDERGNSAHVSLTPDGAFQDATIALLDFEDGTDSCANGTTHTHTAILGQASAGEYVALRFKIGVPFERNHANPALADPPLSVGRMHWSWQAGYKFLRFEGRIGRAPLSLHLGSTGCAGTIGNISACTHPNRPQIELHPFALAKSEIVVQLENLIGDFDGMKPRSCMADAEAPDCAALFAGVGLDPSTGQPSAIQRVFAVADR